MVPLNLSEYKSLYLQTARKYIADMNIAIGQLATDITKKEAIETMFISAHSLKSQSQIMAYTKTGALSGAVEQLFRPIHEGKSQLTPPMVPAVQQALSQIAASVDAIEQTNTEYDLTQAAESLKQFITNTS